jgi:hypothetical protein
MPNETNNPRDGLQHNRDNPGNPGGPPPGPMPTEKPAKAKSDPKSGAQTEHEGGGQHQGGESR